MEVTPQRIKEFIEGLNRLSRLEDTQTQKFLSEIIPDHQQGDYYDLPTEAQWEFVMKNRGNANDKYFDSNSETFISDFAWVSDDRPAGIFDLRSNYHHQPVATKLPRIINRRPFYDLEGNVWELVKDIWSVNIQGGIDPQGPNSVSWSGKSESYSKRGGSFKTIKKLSTTTIRSSTHSGMPDLGFRLIRIRP